MTAERKESLAAWGLGAVGAVKGVGELASQGFNTPEPSNSRTATLGWAAIAGGVALFDRYAPETLTNRAHRTEHPVLVKLAVGTVALHIANMIPPQIDPIHKAEQMLGWSKK